MNWLDIVIIVLIAVPTFLGLKLGIIKAALSLAGVIVGVILAGNFYIPLSEQLTFLSHTGAAEIVAFAMILIGIMVIANVLAGLLKRLTSLVMLGWLNRIGGAAFGLALGAIFCGATLAIWVKFLGIGETITDSILAATLLDYFPIALTLLPAEFDSVSSFFQ